MKKLATLLLAAGMVVASSAPANAVDIKVDARYRTSFATGSDYKGNNLEDIRHRMRLGLTMAASENLKAYVLFQINHGNQYGDATKHGVTSATSEGITAREMYLDWTVPATSVKVRMGRHLFGLPADAFGNNAILGAGYGGREGVIVTAPVADWLGLTAMWARLGTDDGKNLDMNNTDDFYGIAANMKFDGISGSIYGAYATLDDETTMTVNNSWNGGRPTGAGEAYWVGATATLSAFDPFTLKVSGAYGSFEGDNSDNDQDGWQVQAKASYKTAFGTPVLGGWYFSGRDGAEGKDGYMPNAGYFNATRHTYDGFASLTNPCQTNNDGNWAIQAGIEKVSFLSGLEHEFLVTYMKGTNDDAQAGSVFLTEEDAIVEFSLNNTYKIYKHLTGRLELAYIINDFGDATTAAKGDEDDWYAGLTFDFRF